MPIEHPEFALRFTALQALEAYARLRTADHLTVQVNRRGANTNLDYSIK